ncbi:hypothetical protein E2562_016738 [Oryza meyeriana var. granulata]|uniref:Uncharacterized protein n=1 Tax=Oryza meyeriana var. granulata TaxID=110450 RepID=A0A6G1BXD6_9ORYZ|nr:hypothetical protein E2562_016738 [Oryza meyeriana var. granulata]
MAHLPSVRASFEGTTSSTLSLHIPRGGGGWIKGEAIVDNDIKRKTVLDNNGDLGKWQRVSLAPRSVRTGPPDPARFGAWRPPLPLGDFLRLARRPWKGTTFGATSTRHSRIHPSWHKDIHEEQIV